MVWMDRNSKLARTWPSLGFLAADRAALSAIPAAIAGELKIHQG
jgi:hypothetical protein